MVVPYENSTNGLVILTYDLIRDRYLPSLASRGSTLEIVAEQYVSINHNLLTNAKSLDDVRTIYSHPQVWTQVKSFLRAGHLPATAAQIDTPSTSRAAALVAQDLTNTSACISSERSAKLYGLPIRCERIQDTKNNTTRFLVFGKRPLTSELQQRRDRITSVIFTLPHDQPGSLCGALDVFKQHGLSLTAISSRPSHVKQWQPLFFVEFLGCKSADENVMRALDDLRATCDEFVCLGSFASKRAMDDA